MIESVTKKRGFDSPLYLVDGKKGLSEGGKVTIVRS